MFDCFNEDLVWILDKLVDRIGGVAGAISGHVAEESQPTLLATSSAGSQHGSLILELTTRAGAAPRSEGLCHDNPSISYSLLNIRQSTGDTQRYRVLQLSFSPAARVKIVASVAKESRRGFRMLEEAAASRLYPVLSRYVRLWWLHRAERRKAITLASVIDSSDLAIFLLNQESRLLFANSRGQLLLANGDGISGIDHAIQAANTVDQVTLRTAIEAAQDANVHGRGIRSSAHASRVIQVSRREGRRDLIVSVLPVSSPAVDSNDPAVIVYALDPDQDVEQLLEPACGIYKLTPTEARLVRHLVSGSRISEVAQLMRIQTDTARAHLKQIFSKTRTHRQAELVRVMLSSALRANTGFSDLTG